MYTVDGRDRVVALPGVPQSSVGAPIPIVLGDEHSVAVAFYLDNIPEGWDGANVRVVDADSSHEPAAIVHFTRCLAYFSGPPNDEAFSGHPLATRGLEPYGAFEVLDSSWIREMSRRNAVHPEHGPGTYRSRRHLVLTFHDSVFECVASSFRVELRTGSVVGLLPRMRELVFAPTG